MGTPETGQYLRQGVERIPTSGRARADPGQLNGSAASRSPLQPPHQNFPQRPVVPRQLPILMSEERHLLPEPAAAIQAALAGFVEVLGSVVRADRAELEVHVPPSPRLILRWPEERSPLPGDRMMGMAVPVPGWSGGTAVFRAYRRSRLFSREECARIHGLVSRCAPVMIAALHLPRAIQEVRRLERSRLAVSLHQGPAHTLAAAAADLLLRGENVAPQDLPEILRRARDALQRSLTDVRAMVALLRTSDLATVDVNAAIRSTVAHLQRLSPAQFAVDLADVGRLPEDAALAVAAVAAEALANTVRHSGARCVRVRLWRDPQGVGIEIADNGQGFESRAVRSAVPRGYGLAIMADEVRRVGGTLDVHSTPGRGTRVVARVPVRPDATGRTGDDVRGDPGGTPIWPFAS